MVPCGHPGDRDQPIDGLAVELVAAQLGSALGGSPSCARRRSGSACARAVSPYISGMPQPVSATNRRRRSRQRKLALVALGIALVVAGMTLGILPVIPGTPMVLGGLALVTTNSPRGRLLRSKALRSLRRRGALERIGVLGRWSPALASRLASLLGVALPRPLPQPVAVPVEVGERSASTTFRA